MTLEIWVTVQMVVSHAQSFGPIGRPDAGRNWHHGASTTCTETVIRSEGAWRALAMNRIAEKPSLVRATRRRGYVRC